ncbi:sugar ABC transporter permease [Geobacillus sp. FSL K6-0789]|uniref:Maltose/maltodextrin ABC transporter permease protein MalG n=1 Tax=Geobacillus stearothermophilus TaxID=1422 RepID=A0A0K9HYQ8_GEOSE|nr:MULTISPECIES: sugar ABC transporter permease [Geobacillus]KAF6511034.1 Maltose/maltodextrin ABC transporter permease protein MalG [Geobacillus stearothermophilus]KMY61213.1 arabinogalactan ABC transporter permease [Geobacillus stearothermophilus]KMY62433.1 arabinogalactan ABC transporter permease [Geobacillus stearothermophilus]KMY64093.1 arabinogalactan ABC transporter permease [Geobacillus stearothermophilus]MBR2517071.1 sugar ABC transporter permease [Geobacillus sp.]
MNRKWKSRVEVALIYLFIAFMFVVIAYPLLWTISMSLNPGTSLYSASLIPEKWSFEHYKWLFTNPNSDYLLWYKNSLFVAAANAALSVLFTALIAYAFSRYQFVGRKTGLYLFLVLQMFPSLMAMVALYILLNMLNLLDSLWGLILIYVGGQIPFNAWLVKGYFDTIPRELDEAARIDGAGHFGVFFRIMLPLAKPILAVVALFNFMAPFTDFLLPSIVLRDPDKFTLAVGLFNFISDRFANNFTRFAAGSILIAAPIAVVFLFLQRYLISGLTAGGTKG